MTLRRRDLLATPLALGLMGVGAAPGGQHWNGGNPVSDDPLWDDLAAATVTVDRATGNLRAGFLPAIIFKTNQTVTVEGFILPLDVMRSSIHFVLTRRNSGCPFCAPNQPTEAVEILATEPVSVGPELIRMTGILRLHDTSDQGMFYQLLGARRG